MHSCCVMSREILDRVWNANTIRLIGDGVPAMENVSDEQYRR